MPEGVVVDVDDGRLWVSANLSFRPGRTVLSFQPDWELSAGRLLSF